MLVMSLSSSASLSVFAGRDVSLFFFLLFALLFFNAAQGGCSISVSLPEARNYFRPLFSCCSLLELTVTSIYT